jgi:hypothetical protein
MSQVKVIPDRYEQMVRCHDSMKIISIVDQVEIIRKILRPLRRKMVYRSQTKTQDV